MNGKTAILVVNGFDRRRLFGPYQYDESREYPWISLCLRQVERHSGSGPYEVLVYDNAGMPEHRELVRHMGQVRFLDGGGEMIHHDALDFLVTQTADDVEYVITLDSDAFPVRDGWLEELTASLDHGAALSGVWRDEMAPVLKPFIHVSCLCIRRSDLLALRDRGITFTQGYAQDVAQNITNAMFEAGRELAPLRRSNAWNLHFLLGGLYGDLVYHQGAGSRLARFWTSTDISADNRARVALRNEAFADLPGLLAALRGLPEGEATRARLVDLAAPVT